MTKSETENFEAPLFLELDPYFICDKLFQCVFWGICLKALYSDNDGNDDVNLNNDLDNGNVDENDDNDNDDSDNENSDDDDMNLKDGPKLLKSELTLELSSCL